MALHFLSTTLIDGNDAVVHPVARRAITALQRERFSDAQRHVQALADGSLSGAYWAALLTGLLASFEEAPELGEKELFQAAGVALAAMQSETALDGPEGVPVKNPAASWARLVAVALEHAGRALRRRERLDAALATHRAALALRETQGSARECWESAMSAGLDAALARKADDAGRWYERALAHSRRVDGNSQGLLAETYAAQVHLFWETARHPEACAAARAARDAWHAHDAAAVEAPRGELLLGRALLRLGEELLDGGISPADATLADAAATLRSARDALTAFGDCCADDIRCAEEGLDFAQRLRGSLEEGMEPLGHEATKPRRGSCDRAAEGAEE